MAKRDGMNFCKVCEGTYFVTANNDKACVKGNAAHVAQYDFTKNEDVL